MRKPALSWVDTLRRATESTVITDNLSGVFTVDQGVDLLRVKMRGRTTYLIGNGGSLAIAAHMATDFNLAGFTCIALIDPIALTSHANDFGVDAMFTKQLEMAPTKMGDVLLCLSCSGKSSNIIDAARFGHASGMAVITFTGFEHDNPLRSLGELNFYVPAHQYGFVQLAHESILHAACDIEAWLINKETIDE